MSTPIVTEHDADLAAWVLSRPWDPPRWQRLGCEALLAAIGQPHRKPRPQLPLPLVIR